MRSGEREQYSRCRKAGAQQMSVWRRPIALGLALAARGGAASSATIMESSGQQQSAKTWTGRAGLSNKVDYQSMTIGSFFLQRDGVSLSDTSFFPQRYNFGQFHTRRLRNWGGRVVGGFTPFLPRPRLSVICRV